MSLWYTALELSRTAKPININIIQTYQSKTLRRITKDPYYVFNHALRHDHPIPFVVYVAKT